MTKTAETFYFDYTMLSAFLRCRFYYYFRHMRHIVPKITAAPLTFGSTWHSSTELMERGKSLAEAQAHFKKEYINETKDEKRTPERGALMLQVYERKYKDAPLKFLYTEAPGKTKFAIHLAGDVILCGRMDGIVEWNNGGVYVYEKKTTSQFGMTYIEKFELNYQIDSYCLGCMELMGKCNGAIIDAARVVKKPPTMEDDFMRYPVSRTKDELVLAKLNLIEIAKDMQFGPIYQNKESCMLYHHKCPYHDLCMGACDERIVRNSYKIEGWDPTHGIIDKVDDDQLKLFKKKDKEKETKERRVILLKGGKEENIIKFKN